MLRCGFLISSAMLLRLCQPSYAQSVATTAKATTGRNAVSDGVSEGMARRSGDSVPKKRPAIMMRPIGRSFRTMKTFCTKAPVRIPRI